MLWASWSCQRWERGGGESSLGWDVSGYYWYLPSIFIYQDLKGQHFKDCILEEYQFTGSDFQQGYQLPNGNYVLKYSSGMAILFSPLFAIAHFIAPYTEYPADGFSKPYLMAISWGSFLVALIGLWFFRKLLLRYYSDKVVGITLLLLVAGSNYLNYAAIDGGLSHNWLFTLYVFLLLATDNFYKTQKTRYALAIGLVCGLLTLTRPTEILSLLIPFLWQLEYISKTSFLKRIQFLNSHKRKLLYAALLFVFVISIQLIYWKYVSGGWLVYSYGEQKFSWFSPHFFNYTFSYKTGWITYSPMVIFIFTGIIPFIKNGQNKVAIVSFFLLSWYVVCAWDIWVYGGRAMVQSYAIGFIMVASFVEMILRKRLFTFLFTPFFLLFIYFNIWYTVQIHGGQGLYDGENMNSNYYWNVVGRWNVDTEIYKLKETDELFNDTPKNPINVYADTAQECLTKDHQRSRIHRFALPKANEDWLRAEAIFSIKAREGIHWRMTNFTIDLLKDGNVVKSRYIRLQRHLKDNESKKIYFDVSLPKEAIDSVAVSFDNKDGEQTICIENLTVNTFKE